MKITTRGRYGLRAMLGLARRYGGPPVLMSTLARQERLSRKYLHALLASLRSAGLVCAARGVGGGFQLCRPPSEINLSEILHAVEGPLSLVDCVARPKGCPKSRTCAARRVWRQLSGTIEEVLSGVTLADLVSTKKSPAARNHRGRHEQARTPCGRMSMRRSVARRAKPKGRKRRQAT